MFSPQQPQAHEGAAAQAASAAAQAAGAAARAASADAAAAEGAAAGNSALLRTLFELQPAYSKSG